MSKVGNATAGPAAYVRNAGVGQTSATKAVGTATSNHGAQSTSTEAASCHWSKEAQSALAGSGGNEAKIAKLKEAVQQGKFQVDSSRVADRMLDALG